MTAEKIYRLRCDARRNGLNEPPCGTTSETSGGFAPLATHRDYLKSIGWHRTSTGDICPDCWDDGYR